MGAIYQRQFSGHYYLVSTAQQKLISRSLWDTTLNTYALPSGKTQKLNITGPEQQPLLVMLYGYKKTTKLSP